MITDTSHLYIVDARKESTIQYDDRPSGSHRILSKESTAQNITANFQSAASCSGLLPSYLKAIIADIVPALKTGQLVKDAYFTLFEAVGALEVLHHLVWRMLQQVENLLINGTNTQIMDPKMDSGYLTPGETLDDDYDVLRDLQPEEVIGIMDQLICFEVGSVLDLAGTRQTTI